jgi:hypothetical protein
MSALHHIVRPKPCVLHAVRRPAYTSQPTPAPLSLCDGRGMPMMRRSRRLLGRALFPSVPRFDSAHFLHRLSIRGSSSAQCRGCQDRARTACSGPCIRSVRREAAKVHGSRRRVPACVPEPLKLRLGQRERDTSANEDPQPSAYRSRLCSVSCTSAPSRPCIPKAWTGLRGAEALREEQPLRVLWVVTFSSCLAQGAAANKSGRENIWFTKGML